MTQKTLEWDRGTLRIIDQTLLPSTVQYCTLETPEQVWEAIQKLRVRGAPAIGICAAFGVVVAVQAAAPQSVAEARQVAWDSADYLATSRPTAVNLFWALDRMRQTAARHEDAPSVRALIAALEQEAIAILEEDRALCQSIGGHGAPLVTSGMGVPTHCNAGGLATSGYGTALAVLFRAHEQGKKFRVYADETRPLLQGARLTAWELVQAGIDVTVICDGAAAHLMQSGAVDMVVVGADRIACNGDAANKIGTYGLAVLAAAHGIPFYVAAPYSTFDFDMENGAAIPIEERAAEEVTDIGGQRMVAEGAGVFNPAFDVTPSRLIRGIITEQGILTPPFSRAAHTPYADAVSN
ncbi:MAG: S-methyl-5-thioribose-1-phosphate isomerase [Candidatus Hydrogenedentes bacterium]|nr:S-methyl-5-thioribose-1-phosphate isomerase [Candidatus Hydrogenedentota bacterium]